MFSHQVNHRTELRLIQHLHCRELFSLIEVNRQHVRPWHPWIDLISSPADLDRCITKWLNQLAGNRGFYAGIWHEGNLCGVINHLNIDWSNRATVLSYWLDESHQGRGIMTDACRGFVTHAFDTLALNRVSIECATENVRSRAIPERLGFKLEGIIRGAEWLHDHYADHAIYGLLKTDARRENIPVAAPVALGAPRVESCFAAV
jgi:ribosomal-protein-serine acetyltransferase